VTIASGCGGQMQEYQQSEFAGKVVDISQFLIKSGCDFSDQLRPLTASVCLHTPCSLKNVMREEQGAVKLLHKSLTLRSGLCLRRYNAAARRAVTCWIIRKWRKHC